MSQLPTLVLMPGFEGNGKLFAPLIPWLDSHFSLKVIKYPDLASFQDYIDCAQSQLPAEPGYSLLAESFSGPVAIALLAQRPGQIGPSVLCSTFARSPLAMLTKMANQVPQQMFSIGTLSEYCLDVHAEHDEDVSETQPLPLNITEQLDGVVLRHRIAVMSRIDVSALLPQIEAPLLLLHGQRDRIASELEARLIEQNLPGVKRVDIDAAHLLLQIQPQQCAEHIIRHIRPGVL